MAATHHEYRLHPGTKGNGFTSNSQDDVSNMKESSTQTEGKVQGHGPRLSKVNLFTLLSLWMELFPKRESQRQDNASVQVTGLVVVHEQRILGLHCSGTELHAGQVAVIRHGPRLKGCDLYFSRKPCSTCLKMIINAGVNRISYWPANAEISLLCDGSGAAGSRLQEAMLDAAAAERLKSSSRLHICVLLQPLANSMLQFVEETARNSDFLGRMAADDPSLDVHELFRKERWRNWDSFSKKFVIDDAEVHRELLSKMNLENFCTEPYFSELRQHMRDLIRILASVAASVPVLEHNYGFYETEPTTSKDRTLSQDIVRHCIIQAAVLAYRTEDPKVGVGTVIWAEGRLPQCDGTGSMYLVGCGYNAYPVGSQYAEFPQMDDKQEERQRRKYRSADVKEDENTMLFVTKCPCDECLPLIHGTGIKQIYTTDLDSGKDKHDISYLSFTRLRSIRKFIWQKSSLVQSASEQTATPLLNGCVKNRRDDDGACQYNKRLKN
ncbi:cytidine and dCMP deaminase domain-containing protein 1 isoform X2 [Neoarius graeffei]|uniref:cytidine and dCMP deaminase domain-containing protein 1 isoform X2 n=1 Tax=Neoarius graeffei TaxID=443677 RepID=UPI00298D06E9|nr:cytidine and dCMP deaminase domain-containing protein 1 isoform X2 [Neoarius graeffei]